MCIRDSPKEALKEIRSIIDREQPDLLLGNSCGSFLAQMLAPVCLLYTSLPVERRKNGSNAALVVNFFWHIYY